MAATASWQQMEIGAAARDMNAWGYHVAEEATLVDSAADGSMTKKQYVADTIAQKEAGVTTLYSEDMDAGTDFDGLRVVNPFA